MEGKNACSATYDSTGTNGWGPGLQNSCIHSGATEHSGGDTVWYNYALATAGTIVDENTSEQNPATNTTRATESICPKGWTLPNGTQVDSNRNTSSFSPVLGGYYSNGTLHNEDTRGFWWGSTAYNGGLRYALGYNSSNLYTSTFYRRYGFYVRCVPAS